jgi:S-adenosylmethionine decarboxylase proenzyme
MKILELVIDAYGCDSTILNDKKILLRILKESAKKVGAKIIKDNFYKYKPQGISIVLFLAESYISIYTWPEFEYATIGIFLCNEKMDPFKAWEIIKGKIKPKSFKLKRILHLIPNKNQITKK